MPNEENNTQEINKQIKNESDAQGHDFRSEKGLVEGASRVDKGKAVMVENTPTNKMHELHGKKFNGKESKDIG